MHIFREPESREVSTRTWSSPGPEHAWYKWLNGSWNSESLFHEENFPISGMIINGSGLRSLDDYKTFLLITKIPMAMSSKVQWCRSHRLDYNREKSFKINTVKWYREKKSKNSAKLRDMLVYNLSGTTDWKIETRNSFRTSWSLWFTWWEWINWWEWIRLRQEWWPHRRRQLAFCRHRCWWCK